MRLLRSHSSLLLLALAAGALSCGTDLLGPGRSGVGRVALTPAFESLRLDGSGEVLSVGSIVPFTRVRVVLLRANGDTAVDRMVDFPADADSISLSFPVTLSPTAPAEGETLGAVMKYVNATGDTVFASPPVSVQARTPSAGTPPVVTIPLTYVGPGSTAASLVLSPDSVVGVRTRAVPFSAVVRDVQGAVLTNTPVAYTSTDTTVVKVGLTTGAATLVGSRGTALVIAQTVTGQKDTARVTITPTPTAITLVSGNNQQVRQASAFAQPLRVRVTAFDGLGVAGASVSFAVTAGRGTVSAATATTDTAGFAQVTWTAGDTAMVGTVVASVTGPTTLSTTFTGTQLSSGPTSLALTPQPPTTIVAGDTLPTLKVVVLDATLDTVRAFTGAVTMTLTGGTAGASLLGTATVNAVGGVARFSGLAVNRGGTGYKLVAQLPTVPAVPTIQTNAFTVTAAPPAVIQLLTGGSQVTVGGTAFADSVRVRVRDRFGFDVVGATVQFAVAFGGGSVAPTSATTNASGVAATRWTAGPAGAQALDGTVAGVTPLRVLGDAPSSLTLTSGGDQIAAFGTAFAQPIVFTVRGDSGRVLAGVPVVFAVTGGGSVSQVRDTSDASGVVSTAWTAGATSGTFALTATIPGTAIAATAGGRQASTAPSSLAFSVVPRAFVAGDTLPTTVVAIYNGFNELLPNYRGTMSVALVGGTPGAQLLGATTVPVDSGTSAGWFRGLTVDRSGTGYRLVATLANPVLTVTSDTFSVAPAPAAALTLTSGGAQNAVGGTALPAPIVVTAVDKFGFPVRNASVTFTVASGGGTVAPTSATTDSLGRASTVWTVGLTGAQRLSVSTPTATTPRLVSATIPQTLALLGGGGQSALFGSAFPTPISFRVLGDSARPMPGIPVAFTVTGGGTLSQVRDTSDATGLVSVVWTAGTTAGAVTLTGEVVGMSAVTAAASAIQASPAPTALIIQGAPTQFTAGDTIPPVTVRVLNGLGNVVTGYTAGVRLTLGGGQTTGQLVGPTLVNAVAGVATFSNLTVATPGTGYRLFAALDPSIAGVATNTDTFTVLAPPPTGITLVSGGGQTAPEGIPFADSIVVKVVDRFGAGVPGALVTLTATVGGGTVSADSLLTSGGATAGRAAVRWTAGLAGPQQLRVRTAGVPDLLVNASAVVSNGPPALYIGQGDYVGMTLGQPRPITLYLTSPSPTPVNVLLTTAPSGVATWEAPSVTIPAGATQVVTALLPQGLGTILARVTSAIGSDSITVTVDSAFIGLRDGFIQALVGDTVRTQVILQAPAPIGGIDVTVTSLDSAQVLVAPGTGEGLAETPCQYCYGLQAAPTTSATASATGASPTGLSGGLLAPAAGTAVVHIPAGQLVGQLVVVTRPGGTANGPVESFLRIASPGFVEHTASVYTAGAELALWLYDYGALIAGHRVGGYVNLPTPTRRPIDVTVRSLDPTIVATPIPQLTIPPTSSMQSFNGMAEGVSPGLGRIVVEAVGFRPDTFVIPVRRGTLYPSRYVNGGAQALQLLAGTELAEPFSLVAAPDSQFPMSGSTGIRATPVAVTATSSDTTVLEVVTTTTTVPPGETGVFVPLRVRAPGVATVIYAAPGYGADTLTYTVASGDADVMVPEGIATGTVGSIEIAWPWNAASQAAPTEYTLTTADTAVVRILTPLVRLPAGARSVTARLEGRAEGPAAITIASPGRPLRSRMVQVVPNAAAAIGLWAPGWMASDTAVRYVNLYLNLEPASPAAFQVTSSDPSVVQVVDSLVKIGAGARYAEIRIRTIGFGTATIDVNGPATYGMASTTITVSPLMPQLWTPSGESEVIRVGQGLIGEGQLYNYDAVLPAMTYTMRGSGGAGVLPPAAPSPDLTWVFRVASGAGTGADTLRVSGPTITTRDFPVVSVPGVAVPLVPNLGISQVGEVGGYTGITDGSGWFVIPQAPVQTRTFRVVSSDTSVLLVEQDTLVIEGGTGEVLRHARVRGMARGQVTVRLVPIGPAPVLGLPEVPVTVAPAALYHGVYGTLVLGMQQRTWQSEVYVERSFASRKPLWVRLTSSAPQIASVPDSVLIPADSAAAYFPVTAGDTVGAVVIRATAAQHVGLEFPVLVTRTRLQPFAPLQFSYNNEGDLTTGARTTVDVFALSFGDPYAGNELRADDRMPLLEAPPQVPVGFVRPSTVPIPVRFVVQDTTTLAAVRDTATIPANAFVVRTPGVRGTSLGTTRVTIEDRRATSFSRLSPAIGTITVVPSRLAFEFPNGEWSQVPTVPLGGRRENDDLMVSSTSSADTVVVTLQSLRGRVVAENAPVQLTRGDSAGWYGGSQRMSLRGVSAGRDTLVATATGHVPDTLVVEVAAGAITQPANTPGIPATVAVGDSVLVVLGLSAADGAPIRPSAPVTLTIATGTTVQAQAGPQPLLLAAIDAGESFTCARGLTGQTGCWGDNVGGQLGDGLSQTFRTFPGPLFNAPAFTQVVAGGKHTCGLTSAGIAYCWGLNTYGQLGDGSTTARVTATPTLGAALGLTFVALTAGGDHTCGLLTTGEAYCWGRNQFGQLGTGTITNATQPVPVSGTLRFSALTAGKEYTCGIVTATKAAWCWGANGVSQLGDGATTDRLVPTPVAGTRTWAMLSGGGMHTCGVTLTGGGYCWGANGSGQVGAGDFTVHSTPTAITGPAIWSQLAAGGMHTCGIASGNVYCWGDNSWGQVGDSSHVTRNAPVFLGGDGRVVAITAGAEHSCGFESAGTSACWGRNDRGQVGDGTTVNRPTPTFLTAGGAGPITTLTFQPGQPDVSFWLKGVAVGTGSLTVTAPDFGTFQITIGVRVP